MSRESGFHAETLACEYLQQQGLALIARNFTTQGGEIDLIMQAGETLVFVEVRKRSNTTYGSGADSVSLSKQRRILSTARHYLLQSKQYDKVATRIDVIDIGLQEGITHVEWIPNAIWEKW